LDFSSTDDLIMTLERGPDMDVLRAAPEAVDLAVLKALVDDPDIASKARGTALVRRLWDAAGLPDFRKVGAEHHARLVAQLYGHLATGLGHIPADLFANELAKLDNIQGDVDSIAARIASTRTWAYIAHRPDWLADPAHWAGRVGRKIV
jgi:ATP-dependent RNA helicase SUPV3L1/SUV3